MTEGEKIFNRMLVKVKHVYNTSDIQYKGDYHYSVSATTLHKNKVLIAGFNWGVTKGESYTPQQDYPTDKNFYEIKNKASLARAVSYFNKYFTEGLEAGQVNFCFFRSEREKDISKKDLDLTTPLFDSLIEELTPTLLLSFSSKLRDHLLANKKLTKVKEDYITLPDYKRSVRLVKGVFQGGQNTTHFLYLPHPNYPIRTELREKAWATAFHNQAYLTL